MVADPDGVFVILPRRMMSMEYRGWVDKMADDDPCGPTIRVLHDKNYIVIFNTSAIVPIYCKLRATGHDEKGSMWCSCYRQIEF